MINEKSAVCVCVCSPHYQNRKEERTGLNPVASPRLPKGGLRHSETIRGLSALSGGDS